MKKYIILAVILCVAILFVACSGNNEDKKENSTGAASFSNDLESAGWMNQQTLTKETAHSGKFSSRIDSVFQYSFGFADLFKNISETLPEKVDIDFWMLYPQTGIKTNLVVSIDSLGKNIFWSGLELKDSIKTPNQWQEIKATVNLPANIMATDKIAVYIWNNDKKSAYIDDLKVTFGKR